MPIYKCEGFNNYPKLSYKRLVKKIVCYLWDTKDKSILFHPAFSKGLGYFIDADFAGGWKDGNHDCPESILSKTGYAIMFAGCPISLGSKYQTELALSTKKSEYIAL